MWRAVFRSSGREVRLLKRPSDCSIQRRISEAQRRQKLLSQWKYLSGRLINWAVKERPDYLVMPSATRIFYKVSSAQMLSFE